jgi:LmbE family N-acetylglucosaminyl deacetylase
MKKVLFVAVHPDDETLGCGGTILKHKSSGDSVNWLIISNISESDGWDGTIVERRQKEIDEVAALYGFDHTIKLDFPAIKLDTVPMVDLVGAIGRAVEEISPEIIYVPNRSDIHTDHQIAFKAVISSTKNFRYPFIKRVLMYECLSETEISPALIENMFMPNVFVDISEQFEKKIEIMKIYKSELMDAPFPRSIKAIETLARYRGLRIGKEYAESFMLIEEIE